ncbi:N-acetyldiaminopimelate deacetylase [Alkalihalobacillus sp. BA299]|uniref:N-acetyldiaminopimelate deacetylase n=1 Tax=Alkalihalobacillus sp. BA299 TaxID=2815938 RepID=UPI001ADB8F24|nr:N-acetyldiaminopimelate deacetylase [Alkalihalobacillus sp. BA299]
MIDVAKLIETRRALHQIPELGFEEVKTQAFLLEYIAKLPQEHLEIKKWKTGIFVKVHGSAPAKMIGYRADIDGLPMDEETSYPFRSSHAGKMHACGHDFHMTIALGVLTHFSKVQPKDHLLFIFQPAEEGPGGAKPMLESSILQEWRPDQIVALHIAPEYPVGTIATREGLLFANTSELFINLKGQGGHAAYPHTTRDMIVASAHLVTQLQSIVARNVDPLDSAVVTIGKITGGTKQNIIAEKARIEGTIRTLSIESMQKVKQRIEALVQGIEAGFECSGTIDYGANYCQVYNNEQLTREFINFTREQTNVEMIECKEAMTGEDFGYFLAEIPGFMFWLGVNSLYGLHDNRLEPKEEAIEVAVNHLIQYLHYKLDKR